MLWIVKLLDIRCAGPRQRQAASGGNQQKSAWRGLDSEAKMLIVSEPTGVISERKSWCWSAWCTSIVNWG